MNFSNLISTSISAKDINHIVDQLEKIDQKLNNLVLLSAEQKSCLTNIGENTVPFVSEVLEKAKINPELIPGNVDTDEIQKDLDLILAIGQIKQPLQKLMQKLLDSELLASSEAYAPSLALYNALNNANRKAKLDQRASYDHYPKRKISSAYDQLIIS